MSTLGHDNFISFIEDGHKYFGLDGLQYVSVSSILKHVEQPFNENISYHMAKKDLRDSGIENASEDQIKAAQALIVKSWDTKRDNAIDHGNRADSYLQRYFDGRKTTPEEDEIYLELAEKIKAYYDGIGYYTGYNQTILYSKKYKVAGTTDRCHKRTQRSDVFDWFDYKTNLEKGIVFDSSKRKDGAIKHYNRYLLPPLDHLEDCNYVKYSLQISLYALLAELTYGTKTGRLAIIFIHPGLRDFTVIPMPYMKHEALTLLGLNLTKKSIPEELVSSEIKSTSDEW